MKRPRIAEALLGGFIAHPDLEDAILGDLAEEWSERSGSAGAGSADAWYWGQVARSVPHLLVEWWLQKPGRAPRTLARVALVLLLAISAAALTFVEMTGAGGGPSGQPLHGDPHTLAIDMLLAGTLWATASGFFLAWRTSRAPCARRRSWASSGFRPDSPRPGPFHHPDRRPGF